MECQVDGFVRAWPWSEKNQAALPFLFILDQSAFTWLKSQTSTPSNALQTNTNVTKSDSPNKLCVYLVLASSITAVPNNVAMLLLLSALPLTLKAHTVLLSFFLALRRCAFVHTLWKDPNTFSLSFPLSLSLLSFILSFSLSLVCVCTSLSFLCFERKRRKIFFSEAP